MTVPACDRCAGWIEHSNHRPVMTSADAVALDLVQAALIVKLAVDLDDAPLARRAAREAAGHARLLAARVVPTDVEVEVHAAVVDPGLALEELLRRAYPQASLLDDEDDAAELDDDQDDEHDGGTAG